MVQNAIKSGSDEDEDKCTGTSIDQAALLVENSVERAKIMGPDLN